VQPFHAFKVFSGLLDLSHYVVFAEIQLTVNQRMCEVLHVRSCRDNAAFLVLAFFAFLYFHIGAELCDSPVKLF